MKRRDGERSALCVQPQVVCSWCKHTQVGLLKPRLAKGEVCQRAALQLRADRRPVIEAPAAGCLQAPQHCRRPPPPPLETYPAAIPAPGSTGCGCLSKPSWDHRRATMATARSAAEFTAAHPELERELGAALDEAAQRQAKDPLLFVVRWAGQLSGRGVCRCEYGLPAWNLLGGLSSWAWDAQ